MTRDGRPVDEDAARRSPLGSRRAAFSFGALAIISFALSARFADRAGCCTGDTKSAAYGDPVQALALEDWGVLSQFVGIILFSIALTLLLRPWRDPAVPRWAIVTLAVIALTMGSYVLLWNIETWAVQRCF